MGMFAVVDVDVGADAAVDAAAAHVVEGVIVVVVVVGDDGVAVEARKMTGDGNDVAVV